jgi:hypothetical protein
MASANRIVQITQKTSKIPDRNLLTPAFTNSYPLSVPLNASAILAKPRPFCEGDKLPSTKAPAPAPCLSCTGPGEPDLADSPF